MKYLLRILYIFWLPIMVANMFLFLLVFGAIAIMHTFLWLLWSPFSFVLFGHICNADKFLLTDSWDYLLNGPQLLIEFDDKFVRTIKNRSK